MARNETMVDKNGQKMTKDEYFNSLGHSYIICVPWVASRPVNLLGLRLCVLHFEILICKFLSCHLSETASMCCMAQLQRSIDGFSTSSIAHGEVAPLAHELGDDPVENAALVVQRLSGLWLKTDENFKPPGFEAI